MTAHRRASLVALCALMSTVVAAALAVPANADRLENPEGDRGSGYTVLGGTTQSFDPTRYDYVPPTPTPASGGMVTPMSANGYQFLPAFNYTVGGVTIPVPGSYIYHRIDGSGLQITEEEGSWVPMAAWTFQQCNVRFHFQNRSGSTIYSTTIMSEQTGCIWGTTTQVFTPDRTVKTGLQCARLYVSGTYRGEQCHNISP